MRDLLRIVGAGTLVPPADPRPADRSVGSARPPHVPCKADNPGTLLVATETERRSAELGVQFERLPIGGPADVSDAFATAVRGGAQGIFVMDDVAMTRLRPLLLKTGGAALAPCRVHPQRVSEAGGLFAYGPDLDHVYRRGAHYVDRILKGTKPSDLPVEQADVFHFVVNLKTARTLGLTVPPSLLLRANQVIK